MQELELLSPAKNLECGMAAIDHGADAVYIGAERFGARAAANNSIEDIAALCQYAHQYGAKVYVTVNTIIYDDELEDTVSLVKGLDAVGVDAILVQDMGLLSRLSGMQLHCRIHASTQTDNRTIDKVRWLSSLGIRRIVLARELSISEIKAIHDAIPDVELEVFVHGALCVSYSGQCYASQFCFNRSANRGECAQFCRLAFTLKDADGKVLERGRHLLSLRDMNQLANMEKLVDAGAVSFKIEGRLKDAAYIKNVTAAYSQRLNEIVRNNPQKYRRSSYGSCRYMFVPDVNKSFNRGFTTYFAEGRQQGLVSFDTPKAMGEYVGKVKEIRNRSFNVTGTASFSNGDGLCFLDDSRQLVGFRVNKAEGNRIFPLRMPDGLKPSTPLFRNFDQSFNTLLSKPSSERRLGITFSLSTCNDTITLQAIDEMGRTAEASASCELHKAEKPQEENIRKQLSKLGGSIFVCTGLRINTDAFIPSSVLSALRRDVIGTMTAMPFDRESTSVGSTSAPAGDFYPMPYLYNAANKAAQEFYGNCGVPDATSFETAANAGNMLMQCRYCLRNEMGYCSKSGKKAPWKEPLFISLPDGREFQLQFDCRQCQMNILAKR